MTAILLQMASQSLEQRAGSIPPFGTKQKAALTHRGVRFRPLFFAFPPQTSPRIILPHKVRKCCHVEAAKQGKKQEQKTGVK